MVRFLRAAAVLALLQAIGHAVAVLHWGPTHGAGEDAVMHVMQSQPFLFQGLARTYWGFFVGYGFLTAFTCIVEAAMLWQLAALATSGGSRPTGLVVVLLVANIGYAALSWHYFFYTPVALDAAIALCLGAALTR